MSGRQPSGDLLLIVLDENIASEDLRDALAPIAAASDARVELHTAYFPRETKDPVWMPVAAEQHWAVISCDVSVKRRPAEKEILMRAGMCVYILRGGLNRDQIRDALVKALPTICRRHRQLAPPVICHVSREGEVTVKVGERRGGIRRQ
jgi:PIN domain-containing protein